MTTWQKVALAGAAAYVAVALYRAHKGVAFQWALLHPLAPVPDIHSTSDLPVQKSSTAKVLDFFQGASYRTKALTNAFRT